MTLFVTFQYIMQHFEINLKFGSSYVGHAGVDIIKVKTTLYNFGADVCHTNVAVFVKLNQGLSCPVCPVCP